MSLQPFILSSSNLVPKFAVDVIAVYNQENQQVFPGARPLTATISENSKLMEHPLEDGSTIADHSVILPVEIELNLILKSNSYKQTYDEIKQFYLARELLSVQTRTDVYRNQIILALPHEENADYYNTVVIQLKLKEALFVIPQSIVIPINPNNNSTVNKGTVQTMPAAPAQMRQSTAYILGSYIIPYD